MKLSTKQIKKLHLLIRKSIEKRGNIQSCIKPVLPDFVIFLSCYSNYPFQKEWVSPIPISLCCLINKCYRKDHIDR
jgi:hypothetical protein